MAWSGGTFSRTNGTNTGSDTWEQDKNEPVNILASRHDIHDQDLADGINACVKKDGANASNVVATSWIQDGAITTAKLAAGAVTSVATNAIGTDAITNGAVTEAKLADDACTRSTKLHDSYIISAVTNGSQSIVPMQRVGNFGSAQYNSVMPKACKVTHLSFDFISGLTSGSFTVTLYKNDATTGQSVVLSSAALFKYGAITSISFAAGDTLSLFYSFSGNFSGGSDYVSATAWGHFTE